MRFIRRLLFKIGQRLIFMTSPFLSDETYLKLLFFYRCHYRLNLANPKTFNEKLQWLKLNYIQPEYTKMVDKIDAKEYVKNILGEEYIIPTIATWNTVEDIEWNKLPNQFVIKCTSDSGSIVVCKDKSKFDIHKAARKLKKMWQKNYYLKNKEYPYRNIKPRIIAEKYLEDESGYELRDYKFFCFNGVAKYFKIDFDRSTEHHANYYNIEGQLQDFGETIFAPIPNKSIKIPNNLAKMVDVSNLLANVIRSPFVRIDLYNVNGKIYFGEITFFPYSGMMTFTPPEWDLNLGEKLKLPIDEQ